MDVCAKAEEIIKLTLIVVLCSQEWDRWKDRGIQISLLKVLHLKWLKEAEFIKTKLNKN